MVKAKTLTLSKYLMNLSDNIDARRLKELIGSLLNLTYIVADDESELNDEGVNDFQYILHLALAVLRLAEEPCLTSDCINKVINVLRRTSEVAYGCVNDCGELKVIAEELRSLYNHELSYSSYWRF
ncbi:hypothetical protein [Caldivirga maquilingensis]|uniref:Uncharacterized protein n=1 Tax=Caldivirga maquilingensis (strain ATCC 700844 / DSM 13496 / JCM 10307 / IC-167) TaxID=397948 RepID=A8MA50_CALMQ|nr:hypothetical protein [Caldivirga maquilingensis]ABW00982.1 hypothetical protein Cmaq_0132 [Caldivirga maquilingensis IC-167]